MSVVINGTGSISGLSNVGGIASAQSGSVIQTVNAIYSTETTTSSGSYVDTGLTASITPLFSTSKILVIVDMSGVAKYSNITSAQLILLRASSTILTFALGAGDNGTTATNEIGSVSCNYLDSPATSSATTYKVQFCSRNANASVRVNDNGSSSTITLMEIAA
jgi:hypothetical protein